MRKVVLTMAGLAALVDDERRRRARDRGSEDREGRRRDVLRVGGNDDVTDVHDDATARRSR